MKRQLGQVRPSSTSATSLFQPTENRPYLITLINIANVGSTTIKVSLFHDRDGTTWNESTALLWEVEMGIGSILRYKSEFGDYLSTGSLAVQVDTANSATFTLYGELVGERI